MSRPDVLAALDAALKEGELQKTALQEHPAGAPDFADRMKAMELATSVAAILAEQPEYIRQPNMMLQTGFGARVGFQPSRAAYLLILRGMKGEAERGVNWLADMVQSDNRALGLNVMPLWGVTVDRAATLSKDIELIAFSMLPASRQKSWLENPFDASFGRASLPGPLAVHPPTAAITARRVVAPLLVGAEDELREDLDPTQELLDDIPPCLSAACASPVVASVRWFQFDDPELNAAAGSAIAPVPIDILSHPLPRPVALDADAAQRLVCKFLALPGDIRNRVRIALQRLAQAMLRREPGDKAADLSIALEKMMGDKEGGAYRWKISTRAAILIGGDLASKLHQRDIIKSAYDIRSGLVHSGSTSRRRRGSRSPAEICDEATGICAAVRRTVIDRGGIPSWPEFDVSGGVLGWPKTAPPSSGKGS
jgi:Apea-like HEPN